MTQPHPPSGGMISGSEFALLIDPFSMFEVIFKIVLCLSPASTLSAIMPLHVLPPSPILHLFDAFSVMALRLSQLSDSSQLLSDAARRKIESFYFNYLARRPH